MFGYNLLKAPSWHHCNQQNELLFVAVLRTQTNHFKRVNVQFSSYVTER